MKKEKPKNVGQGSPMYDLEKRVQRVRDKFARKLRIDPRKLVNKYKSTNGWY